MKNYFNDINVGFGYKDHVELVILSKERMIRIKEQYRTMETIYVGHSKGMILERERIMTNLKNKEDEIKSLKSEYDSYRKKLTKVLRVIYLFQTDHDEAKYALKLKELKL